MANVRPCAWSGSVPLLLGSGATQPAETFDNIFLTAALRFRYQRRGVGSLDDATCTVSPSSVNVSHIWVKHIVHDTWLRIWRVEEKNHVPINIIDHRWPKRAIVASVPSTSKRRKTSVYSEQWRQFQPGVFPAERTSGIVSRYFSRGLLLGRSSLKKVYAEVAF